MTNQDQMRIKHFLEQLITLHGASRPTDDETAEQARTRMARRSGAMAAFAEGALDLLGEIRFPDAEVSE